MPNTCRFIFTAYGHKVYVFNTHVKIICLDTHYDVSYQLDQIRYDTIKEYQSTVNDLLILMIKKLIK